MNNLKRLWNARLINFNVTVKYEIKSCLHSIQTCCKLFLCILECLSCELSNVSNCISSRFPLMLYQSIIIIKTWNSNFFCWRLGNFALACFWNCAHVYSNNCLKKIESKYMFYYAWLLYQNLHDTKRKIKTWNNCNRNTYRHNPNKHQDWLFFFYPYI